MRWFVAPPIRTAYFSRARSVGVVLRVSRIVIVPPLASTNCRASVAMPDRCCRMFSAVRSPESSARALPVRWPIVTPASHVSPSRNCHSAPTSRIELDEHFERDIEAGERAGRLDQEGAARPIALADNRVRRDIAAGEILCQRAPHEVAIVARLKPAGRRQTAPRRKGRRRFFARWPRCAPLRADRPRSHRGAQDARKRPQ